MSTWDDLKKTVRYPKLEKDLEVDVAIIGGGMAGVVCAYRLARTGMKVVLLEKKELGSGATSATTAFITEVIDTPYSEVTSIFSPSVAKAVWESKQRAISEFESIINEEEIACDFVRCPNYVYASEAKQFKEIEEEYRLYRRYKWPATLLPESSHLPFLNFGSLEIPNQAKFHPTKFVFALAERARGAGAQIFENSEVIDIETEQDKHLLSTKGGIVTAKYVIVATYKPFAKEKTHLKKAMYRSYVLEVEVPKGLFPEAIYEDSGNPYYYFRIDPGEERDRMIVGGEDHKDIFGKSLDKQGFKALGEYLETDLLKDQRYWIMKKWTGPILEPSDGLPLIGEIAPGLFVASAFSGNGMTYSMVSALLINSLLSGKKTGWEKAYDPKRSIIHPKRLGTKAKDYIEEFIQGALKNILS